MEVSNNKTNSIKRWIEIITLVYFYILICGITSKHIFYSFFNVNISEYLEISEIVFLMNDDLIRFLFSIIFGLMLISGIQQIISVPLILISIIVNIKNKEHKTFESLEVDTWYYQILILLLSFMTLYLLKIEITSKVCFILGFGLKYILKYYQNITVRQAGLTVGGLLLTFLIIINPVSKWKDIEKNTKEVSIIMDDNIKYNTGNELKYLGSTKNYTFLYNTTDSLTMVLKRSNINQLMILN